MTYLFSFRTGESKHEKQIRRFRNRFTWVNEMYSEIAPMAPSIVQYVARKSNLDESNEFDVRVREIEWPSNLVLVH